MQVEGQSCDVTGEAPCIIDGYTPAPVVPDYGSAAPVGELFAVGREQGGRRRKRGIVFFLSEMFAWMHTAVKYY